MGIDAQPNDILRYAFHLDLTAPTGYRASRILLRSSFYSLIILLYTYLVAWPYRPPPVYKPCSRVRSTSDVMKMKIHDAPMKDECCYLVAAVLLTCLLNDMNTVLLTCLDYGIGTIQIGSSTGDPPVTPLGTTENDD